MKFYLLSIIAWSSLFAFTAEVKKDSVKLQINENIKTYKKDKTITLKAGDIVCFLEGNGRVVLKGTNYKKQLSKHSHSCKKLPFMKGVKDSSSYVERAKKSVVTFFADAKEKKYC